MAAARRRAEAGGGFTTGTLAVASGSILTLGRLERPEHRQAQRRPTEAAGSAGPRSRARTESSGGGYSAIWSGVTHTTALLVAGGGGGSGGIAAWGGRAFVSWGLGGGGGGAATGGSANDPSAGGGGTSRSGGAAATDTASCSSTATYGAASTGGSGGSENVAPSAAGRAQAPGGGGGGGWYGGGGGACQRTVGYNLAMGGPGGGGSGFTSRKATDTTTSAGTNGTGSASGAAGGIEDPLYTGSVGGGGFMSTTVGGGSVLRPAGAGSIVVEWLPPIIASVTAPATVAAGAMGQVVPVTCTLSNATLTRCDVTLTYQRNGSTLSAGTGTAYVSSQGGQGVIVVPVRVNSFTSIHGSTALTVAAKLSQSGGRPSLSATTTTTQLVG